MKNAVKGLQIGYKLVVALSAGYLVLKATDEKVEELVCDGGVLNAAIIGTGQGALAVVAGKLAYALVV